MRIRKTLAVALCIQLAALDVGTLYAGNVGVDLNIRVGGEPRPVVVTQPPYEPEPYYEVEEEVDFIYPEPLGFYVAVGVPYDLFFYNNLYFVFRDGRWLSSASSRGGWVTVRYRDLPPVIRRHRIERIREYRSREYVIYQRDRDHYRGRHRSDKGYWKAAKHEEKARERAEKRYEKERERDEKRWEKERRHDEKRYEKERKHDEKRFEREHRGRD